MYLKIQKTGSPWLATGPHSVTMNPTASRSLFKCLPGLHEPIFGRKKTKFPKSGVGGMGGALKFLIHGNSSGEAVSQGEVSLVGGSSDSELGGPGSIPSPNAPFVGPFGATFFVTIWAQKKTSGGIRGNPCAEFCYESF